MSLESFHEAVGAWFRREIGVPTAPQRDGWPRIVAGGATLIAAPTGSGKTLAAFLSAIDGLVRDGLAGRLGDEARVLYVSPLKALGNDIQRNLEAPLAGISSELEALGLPRVDIRTMVRTGDTSNRDRTRMISRPPHIVVTTPESFYILLTSEGGRRLLSTVRTVIIDEVHALVGGKRGSHLALSLARLDALTAQPAQRIGLSATQRPIERVARYLVGRDGAGAPLACSIVDSGHLREIDLAIELPKSPLEAVMAGEVWEEVYDRLAELIREHRTTLVFVNTRRTAERVTRKLSERLSADLVTSHHGSLSKEHRFDAEQRLKAGKLRALVATASLELGIDIGSVDLVCQIGSTRSIASLLQRAGRAGHHLGGISRGRLFPLSRDDLVECAALLYAVRRGDLDRVTVPDAPLDILAQQIVAAAAAEEWSEDDLYALMTSADPYAGLSRESFDAVVKMLADGFSTRRGRTAARLHRDGVAGKVRGRRGTRLIAITSGGAIPDNADYEVVLDPTGERVGTVNEDFAIESMGGDIFQLGNASWKILRVLPGVVRVEDARGQPPTIPFWLGEAPGRTGELSHAVSDVRIAVGDRVASNGPGEALEWLVAEAGVSEEAARQVTEYLAAGFGALGAMPSEKTLVIERFFDESGGMQLVVHSPFGSRINRAWGLSLRKRFCQRFDFELQAAATEDAIVLSLGPTHSFPLEEVFDYLRADGVRDLLVQAVLIAPMFTSRWRWNATRSLAVLRWRGGKRVPPRLQRMDAEDLAAVVFPDQVACQDNLPGKREVPDHPLVQQTVTDCLVEAMDIDGFEALLREIAAGNKRLVARDTTEPSPFAQEILTARPYAFLDDAPLEERRTQAVYARRWLDPRSASDIGALDLAAIERVRSEAWPAPTSADELHETLVLLGYATEQEAAAGGWAPYFDELCKGRRATRVMVAPGVTLWVAADRLPEFVAQYRDTAGIELVLEPEVVAPRAAADRVWDPDEALVELTRGRLEALGPITAERLAESAGLTAGRMQIALGALEAEGFVLRGTFTPGSVAVEWCERRLLARIHRYTLGRLRSEIEPVTQADFVRFLCSWQRVLPDTKMRGPASVATVLAQLEGFEAPASAWEAEILPARIADYEPGWLDALCLSGRFVWLRRSLPPARPQRVSGPVRSTPIALVPRSNIDSWRSVSDGVEAPSISGTAERVRSYLATSGASFFDDVVSALHLVRAEAENALGELVATGLVTSDAFAGIRALVVPSTVRARGPVRRRRGNDGAFGMENAGRWSLLASPSGQERAERARAEASSGHQARAERARDERSESSRGVRGVPPGEDYGGGGRAGMKQERAGMFLVPQSVSHAGQAGTKQEQAGMCMTMARVLLRRYGVVLRRVIEREDGLPPWRELLRALRTLEARGEIRGGRFVAGFSGEQYALPEAVEALRAMRRAPKNGALVSLSAADPLNLIGILTPGERVPAVASNRVLYRDGVPVARKVGEGVEILAATEGPERHELESALVRRAVPGRLRAHLGRFA